MCDFVIKSTCLKLFPKCKLYLDYGKTDHVIKMFESILFVMYSGMMLLPAQSVEGLEPRCSIASLYFHGTCPNSAILHRENNNDIKEFVQKLVFNICQIININIYYILNNLF